MKKQVLPIIALVIFSISAMAQTFSSGYLLKLNKQDRSLAKRENLAQKIIKKEALTKEIKESKETMSINESIIDSIVYYQYETDSDSVLITKFEYDYYESGLAQTRYEYAWNEENSQWIIFKKRDYTYGEAELLISLNSYIWDVDFDIWINDRVTNWEFNDDGNEEYYEQFRWNVDLDRWDKYFKDEISYNDNGDLLMRTVWEGDEQNEWIIYYVYEVTYNDENLLFTGVLSFWNSNENELYFYQKEEFSYNSSGLREGRLYYIWSDDEWELRINTNYYYTATNKVDSAFNFHRVDDEWTLMSKQNFDYDDNDNEILYEIFDWDGNQLVNNSKSISTFDSNNNLISKTISNWSVDNNDWVYDYKFEHAFDENSNQTMYSFYMWDINLDIWVGNTKDAYVFDEEGQYNIKIYYKWDESIADWVFDEKGFYYRTPISGFVEFSNDNLVAYPNPVNNVLNIERENPEPAKCYIVSTNGQILLEFELTGYQSRINIESLNTGVYLLQINNDEYIITKKIIKQ